MRFTKAAVALVALSALALTGCAGGSSDGSAGDETPGSATITEDVRFIVPFPAGSAPDSTARVIAQEMEADLGVSVLIENIEGGSSTIGLLEAADSDPDGTTIVFIGSSTAIQVHLVDSPFTGYEMLTPIAQTNLVPNLIYAAPSHGWSDIDDFIAAAKKKPGMTVGLGAPGSIQDVQIALLEESAGIDLEPVYFGAGQMVVPAANGTVDVSVSQPGPVMQFVDTGELDLLGVLGDDVPPNVDAPLVDDSGLSTSDFVAWEGVFGPAGMSDDIRDALGAAVERAVQSDAFADYIETTYGVVSFVGPEEFSAVVADAESIGAELVDRLGLSAR